MPKKLYEESLYSFPVLFRDSKTPFEIITPALEKNRVDTMRRSLLGLPSI